MVQGRALQPRGAPAVRGFSTHGALPDCSQCVLGSRSGEPRCFRARVVRTWAAQTVTQAGVLTQVWGLVAVLYTQAPSVVVVGVLWSALYLVTALVEEYL